MGKTSGRIRRYGVSHFPIASKLYTKSLRRCGAGLLVHILAEEGYDGIGLDIRSRKSWNLYPDTTKGRLQVYPFDPLEPKFPSEVVFKPGVFLIGNHADELSPWLPIISALVDSAAYLSIPCCPWALDQRFHRFSTVYPPLTIEEDEIFKKKLGATCKSTYGSYLCYLATLSRECGFKGEYEALRIPSTRNWSIIGTCIWSAFGVTSHLPIGRTRSEAEQGTARAKEMHSKIVERGLFKARQGVNSNH
jgi:tRNASer (uridine44-2'-O)-methyltransferase